MSMKFDLSALKEIEFAKVTSVLVKHWVLLLCSFIVVAAPIAAMLALPMVTNPIQEKVKQHIDAFERLNKLEKVEIESVNSAGESEKKQVDINPKFIDEVNQNNERFANDAKNAYQLALDRNQRGRGLAKGLSDYLPIPVKESSRDVNLLRENALPLLIANRDALLASIKFGGAPKSTNVLDRVQRAESEHVTGVLMKKQRSEVTDPKEIAELKAILLEARISALVDEANKFDLYMEPNSISWHDIVVSAGKDFDAKSPKAVDLALAQLFQFQWDIWLVDDVLAAIQIVNKPSATAHGLMQLPLKRIERFQILPIPGLVPSDTPAPVVASGEAPAEAVSGESIDAKADVALDFALSFNGLHTNQLFDVRDASLVVVCETSEIPKFVNALAAQNFITVTNLSLVPIDTFAEAKKGYAYGGKPCSQVTLRLQSVWLRDWTVVNMPKGMMAAIKTAGKPAAIQADPSAPPPAGG